MPINLNGLFNVMALTIHQNITDAIGQLDFSSYELQRLKEQLGNPEKINPQINYKNIQTFKNMILHFFQQYSGTRKTYNHDIIEIEDTVANLEKDFIDIFSLVGEPTKEQVIQLEGIIVKLQNLIVHEIQGNPTYYRQLKENFPDRF